jgi:putative endonuclease
MSRVSGKSYFTYVLWSACARRFYVGITVNPARRLAQHNLGKFGWTKRHGPWEIVFTEEHDSYTAARKQELQLKAQKGGLGFYAQTGLDPARFRRRGS